MNRRGFLKCMAGSAGAVAAIRISSPPDPRGWLPMVRPATTDGRSYILGVATERAEAGQVLEILTSGQCDLMLTK